MCYTYLEVVARGFVCQFNCSNLLINTRDEFIEKVNLDKKRNYKIKICSNNDDSVFANLKKPAPVTAKKVETVDNNLRIKGAELPIMERGNKYIYMGSIEAYQDRFKEESADDNSFMNIDYGTFKSMDNFFLLYNYIEI